MELNHALQSWFVFMRIHFTPISVQDLTIVGESVQDLIIVGYLISDMHLHIKNSLK